MTEIADRVPAGLDPRFVVDLKGRSFPMYAGVLDMASRSGLVSLRTEILQIPTTDNGGMAIVSATALFEDGRVFTDIGDASPASVKALMVPAVLRMASTRAKGRVLRDAMNVGQALLEELDEETERIADSPIQRTQTTVKAPLASPPSQEAAPSKAAPKLTRADLETRYLDWLEKAARLGAVRRSTLEFEAFRSFDPKSAKPDQLAKMCSDLKAFVHMLETWQAEDQSAKLDLEMDAAASAERDPFAQQVGAP